MAQLLTGNEAIARGAYEAGVFFAAAYPGTPSTEILENLAKYEEVDAQWSPNEKVALEAGIGAALGGARSLVSMKHVGLNVAADPLFAASYVGVNAGLVIVTADDPGMHSSQDEQDNRYYARFAKLPMLEPSDSQEAKDFAILAFEISEEYNTPVLLRITTRIAHGRSPVRVGERAETPLKDYRRQVEKCVLLPANARRLHPKVEERISKLALLSEKTPVNRVEWGEKSRGIVTSGAAYQYVREACPKASVLKIGLSYPLPSQMIREFALLVSQVVVVEELEPLLEEHIRALGIEVEGKELFPRIGELSTEEVRRGLGMNGGLNVEPEKDIPERPPVLCPGCPHRGVFYVLNKLGAVVTGDIGCYTLGALPPLTSMDTCLCMGASIGNALGMGKARGEEFGKKVVAVIGDSTFLHSGITGLMDAVYNHGVFTTVILDNRTTAMTGHQHHPGTGCSAKGLPASRVSLEGIARGLGVGRVRTVDPSDLAEVETALMEEMAAGEPSVIIASRACALLDRGERTTGQVPEDCTGCGICLQLGCPVLSVRNGQARIDPELCEGCGLCAQVCPRQPAPGRGKVKASE